MGSHIPLVIVAAIVALTMLTGVVTLFVRERKTLAGYEEIEADVKMLKSKLGAEIFRDGNDLVISGTESKVPVVVRFSFSENTPGMNIRLHGPATMNLAVIPKSSQFMFPENLRLHVNTPDEMFNARFLTRADDGSAARMFLMSRSTMKELQKALCSSRTTLNITHGALELTETTVPQPYTGRHVAGHIESLLKLSNILAQMPGAQLSVVEKPKLPKRLLTKSAIAIGAIAALVSIVGAASQLGEAPPPPKPVDKLAVSERGAGVVAVDMPAITELENFRTIEPKEMDESVVGWMKARNLEPAGRVPLDLTGAKDESDVAYLLTDPQGRRRLVILSKGKLVFDGRNYGLVSIIGIPKGYVPSSGSQPATNDGDGLLLVQDTNPASRAFLFYMNHGVVATRAIADWTQIELR